MKYAAVSIGIIGILYSGLALANTLSSPVIDLGGAIVKHENGGVGTSQISLKPLAGYGLVPWNLVCDFKIVETGGASPPTETNPLIATVYTGNVSYFSGVNYSDNNFTATTGTIETENLRAFLAGSKQVDSIHFQNYDATGDLIISNCTATLVLNH